jgi:subfamily B ATP-binding cassette protein MsbA
MIDVSPESRYNTRNLLQAKSSGWRIYKRLLGYAWHYKGRLLISIFFALVVAFSFSTVILGVAGAVRILYSDDATAQGQVTFMVEKAVKVVGRWTSVGLPGPSPAEIEEGIRGFIGSARANPGRALEWLCVGLVLLSLVGGTARFLQEYFAGAISANVSVTLGEEMFDNVMRLSIPFFERRSSGEILARFTNDMFMVNRGLTAVFVKLFREPIKAVFFLGIALATDWALTLTVLLVLPLTGYVIIRIGRKVKKSVRRSLQKIASMASVIGESIAGIYIVKAFCMEQYENTRVRVEMRKLRRHLLRMVKADAAIEPATEFLMIVGLVLFILLAARARLNLGDLFQLLSALAAMMDPIRKLSSVNNMIQTSVASAERVFEFIDLRSEVVQGTDAVALSPLRDTLEFRDVRFSYDGKTDVLRGVNFKIKKGEMLALVGFSGAGKSTVVKLIPRFYDATGGSIMIDGVDIRGATLKSLREQISMVTQDTILFNESIHENIAFGRPDYSRKRVEEAAAAARASEFIKKLPQSYDNVIGESGGLLSGGQRQRLAIARAIIKDPSILILDEATSSLDSESEQAIQKAIEQFIVGRTTIVIAHRLSTVQRADRILVIDEGRVVEEGTHQELIAQGGLYRRLYDTQFHAREGQAAL